MVLPDALLPGGGVMLSLSCGEVTDESDADESDADESDADESDADESGKVIGSDVEVSDGADVTDVILGKLGEF